MLLPIALSASTSISDWVFAFISDSIFEDMVLSSGLFLLCDLCAVVVVEGQQHAMVQRRGRANKSSEEVRQRRKWSYSEDSMSVRSCVFLRRTCRSRWRGNKQARKQKVSCQLGVVQRGRVSCQGCAELRTRCATVCHTPDSLLFLVVVVLYYGLFRLSANGLIQNGQCILRC